MFQDKNCSYALSVIFVLEDSNNFESFNCTAQVKCRKCHPKGGGRVLASISSGPCNDLQNHIINIVSPCISFERMFKIEIYCTHQ